MSTSIAPESATSSHDGSVSGASQAILGLLSRDNTRDTAEPSTRQPEQRPETSSTSETSDTQESPAAEQAPAATAEEQDPSRESEPADSTTEGTDEPSDTSAPRLFTVKIDGKDEQVPEDELVRGYSRTQDYTRKTMALAQARKSFEETEVAAVRQEREQYRQTLTKLEEAITLFHPKEPDWAILRAQVSPDEYVAKRDEWDDTQKRVTAIREERARVEAQQAEDAKKGYSAHVDAQRAKLIEADPDFGDPTKAPELGKALSAFAKERGFSDEELTGVADHRLVLLLRDAMRYRDAQSKAPAIKTKIEKAIATTAPGGSKANQPKASKGEQAMARLQKTGRVEDAAAAILTRL